MRHKLHLRIDPSEPNTVRDIKIEGCGNLTELKRQVARIPEAWVVDGTPHFLFVTCNTQGNHRVKVISLLDIIEQCGFKATATRFRNTGTTAASSHFGIRPTASLNLVPWVEIEFFKWLCYLSY